MSLSPAAVANRRGILCMVGAMASFVSNDALVKFSSQSMPSAQLIFVRGAMAMVLVLAVAHALGGEPRGSRCRGDHALPRFALLPAIGNATAINLTAPLFIAVFAAIFMGKRVRGAVWLAIGAGFMGVLLVAQPRAEGFNSYALACLLGTLFHDARDLMTRRIDAGIPSILIMLATAVAVAVTVLAGVLSLIQGWQPFGLFEFSMLTLPSVFLAAGYYLILSSMRHGKMTLVAPYRYSGLLFALVLGYAVWGDVPNTLDWSGIALLIVSGQYVLHSEKRRHCAGGAK